MTDETVIPFGEFKPTCPQCGAELLIEHDGIESKSDDRVFCATHGTVGTRETVRSQIFEENRDQIEKSAVDHAKNLLRDMLKNNGFKLD